MAFRYPFIWGERKKEKTTLNINLSARRRYNHLSVSIVGNEIILSLVLAVLRKQGKKRNEAPFGFRIDSRLRYSSDIFNMITQNSFFKSFLYKTYGTKYLFYDVFSFMAWSRLWSWNNKLRVCQTDLRWNACDFFTLETDLPPSKTTHFRSDYLLFNCDISNYYRLYPFNICNWNK